MSTTPMTKIREEFIGAKQLNQFWTKQTTVDWDKIADWWLNRFQQELEKLEGEIEAMKADEEQEAINNGEPEKAMAHNSTLDAVLDLIRQHKEG